MMAEVSNRSLVNSRTFPCVSSQLYPLRYRVHATKDIPHSSPSIKINNIFVDMQWIAVVSVFLGLLPVRFKPFRISFSLRHSTLLWGVFVQVLLLWSAVEALKSRLEECFFPGLDNTVRLRAIFLMWHVSAVCIPCLFWMQTDRVTSYQAVSHKLASYFNFESNRRLNVFIRTNTVTGYVSAVTLTVLYLRSINDDRWTRWSHAPAHIFATSLVANFPHTILAQFLSLQSCALQLKTWFGKELRSGDLTRDRVQHYWEAWLTLRELTVTGVTLPAGTLAFLVYTIVLLSLCAYESLMLLTSHKAMLCAVHFVGTTVLVTNLMFLCDACEGAADAVQNCISDVIRSRNYIEFVSPSVAHQVELLHEQMLGIETHVTVGGFCLLQRRLVSSVVATAATYLVVLFQMPVSDSSTNELSANNTLNDTIV